MAISEKTIRDIFGDQVLAIFPCDAKASLAKNLLGDLFSPPVRRPCLGDDSKKLVPKSFPKKSTAEIQFSQSHPVREVQVQRDRSKEDQV